MTEDWTDPDGTVVERARALIDQSRFADPNDDDDPLGEVFDLVLDQGTLQPEVFSVLDDLCRVLPDRPDVANLFFSTLLDGLDASLGHPRWTHPLVDDYRYPHPLDHLLHDHLVRIAPHVRPLLQSDRDGIRVSAASLLAHAGREHPEWAADVWESAVATTPVTSRAWSIGGLKCFLPQPTLFEPLETFLRDPKTDPLGAFTALCVLFHWGAYAPQNPRTPEALKRLTALQEAALGLDVPVSPDRIRADGQVARGRALTDPAERWAGWTPLLSDNLFTSRLLGRVAFDVMGDPPASRLLADRLTQAVQARPGLRENPAWEGVTAMVQAHGVPFPAATAPLRH